MGVARVGGGRGVARVNCGDHYAHGATRVAVSRSVCQSPCFVQGRILRKQRSSLGCFETVRTSEGYSSTAVAFFFIVEVLLPVPFQPEQSLP